MRTDLLMDPEDFAAPWSGVHPPMAIVDLNRMREADPLCLPPFPLLGLGDPRHPLADRLDACIASPAEMTMIADAVVAQPQAAAVLVQLLRLIEGMDMAAALVAESMAYGVLQGSGGHARWLPSCTAGPSLPAGRIGMERRGGRLNITMDRPAAHNAIDRIMRDGLREAFDLAAMDSDIERIMLRGTGRSFSVGADLSEFGTTRDPATAHSIRMLTLPAQGIVRCCARLDVHVQGACVGSGLEMAAFADRLTAGRKAWFQLPELAMGIIPGAGGCVSLSRRIGRQKAALLILSGRRINAEMALAMGLVDAIIDDSPVDQGHADIASVEPGSRLGPRTVQQA